MKILPYTSVLVNGIYWDERYPRLLENKEFAELNKSLRLISIADISCDIQVGCGLLMGKELTLVGLSTVYGPCKYH